MLPAGGGGSGGLGGGVAPQQYTTISIPQRAIAICSNNSAQPFPIQANTPFVLFGSGAGGGGGGGGQLAIQQNGNVVTQQFMAGGAGGSGLAFVLRYSGFSVGVSVYTNCAVGGGGGGNQDCSNPNYLSPPFLGQPGQDAANSVIYLQTPSQTYSLLLLGGKGGAGGFTQGQTSASSASGGLGYFAGADGGYWSCSHSVGTSNCTCPQGLPGTQGGASIFGPGSQNWPSPTTTFFQGALGSGGGGGGGGFSPMAGAFYTGSGGNSAAVYIILNPTPQELASLGY